MVGEQMALALEAFHASRAIVAEPLTVRGGPWVKPTLPKDEDAKIFLVSTMRLAALLAYAESRDSELLWRHMKNLRFGPAEDAPNGSVVQRGVFVVRKKKSGKATKSGPCGCRSRRDRVQRGVLKRPSAEHKVSHRGRDPQARRRDETAMRSRR